MDVDLFTLGSGVSFFDFVTFGCGVVLDTLGSGVAFGTLGSGASSWRLDTFLMIGKAGMSAALLKMRANYNIALCILLPDCNSGVTVEGGLARIATISLLACLM